MRVVFNKPLNKTPEDLLLQGKEFALIGIHNGGATVKDDEGRILWFVDNSDLTTVHKEIE